MLAIEGSEIGGTIIALSVPGLQPLFGHYWSRIGESYGRSYSGAKSNEADVIGVPGGTIGSRRCRFAAGLGEPEQKYIRDPMDLDMMEDSMESRRQKTESVEDLLEDVEVERKKRSEEEGIPMKAV